MTRRVVAVHRYFWPDTPPYASILRAIADRWSERGDDITVITAQPSYTSSEGVERRPRRERLGRLSIERVPVVNERRVRVGKLLNMAVFPAQVASRVLRGPRPDVVMCSTAPQVLLGVAVSLAARTRRARFIYHCMDLHPEIGRLSGEFSNPIIYRALMRLDVATMRRSAAVVVLSDDMRRAVLDRDPALEDRVVVLNNFALPDFDSQEAQSPLPKPAANTLRIVFTGNIGRFQRLEDVIRALADVQHDVELVLMGDGHAKASVKEEVSRLRDGSRLTVTMLPHGSPASARALMTTAHLGLVSLATGVVRFAYPSKTATYLCEGLPVLVYCDADSELASTVSLENIGWSASTPDQLVNSVMAAVETYASSVKSDQLSTDVRRYAEVEFGQESTLARWEALEDRVDQDRSLTHV